MEDPPRDDGTLSSEDLRRLGLAGQGHFPTFRRAVRRMREDLASFRRNLRPTWRGLLRTVLLCVTLSWLGRDLGLILRDWGPFEEETGFGAALVERLLSRLEAPWFPFTHVSYAQWNYASVGLHPLLLLAAGFLLLRKADGRSMRMVAGAASIATGVATLALAIAGPGSFDAGGAFTTFLVPNVIGTLAAGSLLAWLGHRATGLASPVRSFATCAPALVATLLVTFHLDLVFAWPVQGFAMAWNLEGWENLVGDEVFELFEVLRPVMQYVGPVFAGALFLLPGLIVLRGHSIRSALRTVWRILVRRSAGLGAAIAGLYVVALVSPGSTVLLALEHVGWVDLMPASVAQSLLFAAGHGLDDGLFIYAIALAATALHDSLPPTPAVTPPDAD